jgi:hypothetical protein
MNLQDLANLAQAVGAATVVGGTVFALVQFFEYKKQRRESVAAEVMRTFIGPELSRAITILRGFPDGVSAAQLRDAGFDAEYSAILVCMTFETLGVLVFRRIAPFPLVVELAGGIIVVLWRKLGPWLQQIREEQQQPSWAEWFEWLAVQCERRKDERTPAYRKHANWTPRTR